MLLLNRYILFLVLWLAFFFNVERLHIRKTELVDIAGPVYALIIALVVIALVVAHYSLMSRWTLQLCAGLLFVLVKYLSPRPFWGEGYTYVTLFEFGSVLVTTWLAYEVGSRTAEFIRTVRTILFVDMQDRVLTPERASPILQREIQRSRRTNHPLTVLVVETQAQDAQIHLDATAKEVQQLLVKRERLVALTRFLIGFLRSTDFILEQSEKGRLVFVTPEVNSTQAAQLVRRLGERAQQALGVRLQWGAATFPEQGLTLEELIYQAELDLKRDTDTSRVEAITIENPASIEESLGVNTSFGASGE